MPPSLEFYAYLNLKSKGLLKGQGVRLLGTTRPVIGSIGHRHDQGGSNASRVFNSSFPRNAGWSLRELLSERILPSGPISNVVGYEWTRRLRMNPMMLSRLACGQVMPFFSNCGLIS